MNKPKREICLKAYITQDEHDRIKQLAEQTGLSISEYVRRVLSGSRVDSRIDQTAFLAALKVNADLGRLGGLFKLYLSQDRTIVDPEKIRKVLFEIEDRQDELRPIIQKIREAI
ncbi:plasmid mobilization protein [Desulforhopalus singaporensis]|uniref:Ribbon-helix-helix protein, copG family n=1 Tax=Desulforhopalus singaporensis TaxID=91360 RepID=A0A1H0PAZ0_9BACT|nr:CopG family transcriptional regulator [Desulforhopalus singaporensis]SDP01819.1 hypothetical protein SAMN05660330_01577 [Desulforhopalus singaporensis]